MIMVRPATAPETPKRPRYQERQRFCGAHLILCMGRAERPRRSRTWGLQPNREGTTQVAHRRRTMLGRENHQAVLTVRRGDAK